MTMHKLKINHVDIKRENIMFSPSFKKSVFIDFGTTTYVKENKYEPTRIMGAMGTLEYMGPEMQQAWD